MKECGTTTLTIRLYTTLTICCPEPDGLLRKKLWNTSSIRRTKRQRQEIISDVLPILPDTILHKPVCGTGWISILCPGCWGMRISTSQRDICSPLKIITLWKWLQRPVPYSIFVFDSKSDSITLNRSKSSTIINFHQVFTSNR